jgi:hypothetical protein
MPFWEEVQRRATMVDGAAAWSSLRLNLADRGEMQPIDGLFVSGGFFSTLGVPAVLGRTLTPADGRDGNAPDHVRADCRRSGHACGPTFPTFPCTFAVMAGRVRVV